MASKPKPDPTPATANDNLRLWDKLGKTDPRHTKQFTRGGGFKGTAMKPMWQNKLLTETFGPCGTGWGFHKPEFQIVDGVNDEKLVFCTVTGWYVIPGTDSSEVATVYGVGGDKIIARFKSGPSNDDEAFKKAFTDAIGNAFKFIGVGADVHMGQFDDSKYVQDLRAEFEADDDKLGKDADAVTEAMRGAKSIEELNAVRSEHGLDLLIAELQAHKRGEEAAMLASTYRARKAALAPKPKAEANDASTNDTPAATNA